MSWTEQNEKWLILGMLALGFGALALAKWGGPVEPWGPKLKRRKK